MNRHLYEAAHETTESTKQLNGEKQPKVLRTAKSYSSYLPPMSCPLTLRFKV